jgi:hypothetical protein
MIYGLLFLIFCTWGFFGTVIGFAAGADGEEFEFDRPIAFLFFHTILINWAELWMFRRFK